MKNLMLCLFVWTGLVLSAAAQTVKLTPAQALPSDPMPSEALPEINRSVQIIYPPNLEQANVQGYVLALYRLGESNRILKAWFEGTHSILCEAVEDAARYKLYQLSQAQGKPGSFWLSCIFNPPLADEMSADSLPRLLAVAPVFVARKECGRQMSKTVSCVFSIDTIGQVKGLRMEDPADEKYRQVIEASLPQWRFAPARSQGQAVATDYRFPVLLLAEWMPNQADKFEAPLVLSKTPPVYPLALRRLGYSGNVEVEFFVDKHGFVSEAAVIKTSHPGFVDPAVDAVLSWRFKPGTRNGQAVAVKMRVPINFSLDNGAGRKIAEFIRAKSADGGDSYDLMPELLSIEDPIYPYEAMRTKLQGKAKISVQVGEDGQVQRTEIMESSGVEFGLSAQAWAERLSFHPALKDNKPVPSLVILGAGYVHSPQKEGWWVMPQPYLLSMIERENRNPDDFLSPAMLDQPLKAVSKPTAKHPRSLANQSGSAELEFIVNEYGKVVLPRIIASTAPAFGYAAVQALSHWRYNPPKANGQPALVRTRIQIKFEAKP
jgi:TonB family protein